MPVIAGIILYATEEDKSKLLLDLLVVFSFFIFYAFFFFKVFYISDEGIQAISLLNPVYRKVSYNFTDIDKVIVRAVGLRGGIDSIVVVLKNCTEKRISFSMMRFEKRILTNELIRRSVKVDDFV